MKICCPFFTIQSRSHVTFDWQVSQSPLKWNSSVFSPFFLSFIIFSKSIGQLFCVMTLSLGSSLGSLWFDQVLDPRGDLSCGWHRMSVWPILVMVSLVRWLRRCRWGFSTGKSLFFPSVILWLINILGGKILAWSPFPHQTWDSTK